MEWLPFFGGVLFSLLVIYLPGLLTVRACHFSWLASFIVAPAITGFLYISLGLIFAFLNMSISGSFLFFVASSIGVLSFAASALICKSKERRYNKRGIVKPASIKCRLIAKSAFIVERIPDSKRFWLFLLFYITVAFCVSCVVFLGGIESPETFSREFDAGYHYTAVRSFLNNGIFSILDSRTFPDIPESGQFYPALWHIICAIVSDISGCDVTISANAVIFATLVFVIPSGVLGELSWIFKKNNLAVFLGGVCALAFAGYPWGNLIFGQLVSNFYSVALLPSAFLLFMMFCKSMSIRHNRILHAFLLICAFVSLAGAQPNSVFSAGIFCLFFLMHVYSDCIDRTPRIKHKVAIKILGCFGILLIGCLVWASFFLIPMIQMISIFNEYITYDTISAIIHSIFLSFSNRIYPQFVLAIICWIGFFAILAKKGKRWLCPPFLIGLFIYVVSASCLGPFCHAISGFWYNDIYRTSALVCVFAMPLAAFGLATIVRGLVALCSLVVKDSKARRILKKVFAIVVAMAFIPANYLLVIPYSSVEEENQNSFERIGYFFHRWYSWDTDFGFNGEQYMFLQKAEELIDEDPGLIINIPYDGSGWMYGVDGLNTMYRTGRMPNSSPIDNASIRHSLDKYSKSKKVQEAVESLGAKYFLRLAPSDSDMISEGIMSPNYNPEQWAGLNAINDDTPGFEPVMKKGEMRLYKIMDPEEASKDAKEKKRVKANKKTKHGNDILKQSSDSRSL